MMPEDLTWFRLPPSASTFGVRVPVFGVLPECLNGASLAWGPQELTALRVLTFQDAGAQLTEGLLPPDSTATRLADLAGEPNSPTLVDLTFGHQLEAILPLVTSEEGELPYLLCVLRDVLRLEVVFLLVPGGSVGTSPVARVHLRFDEFDFPPLNL